MANRYRGAIYTGVTSNISARPFAHREGRGSSYVRRRGLLRLVWAEHVPSIQDAIEHEKRLKRWRRDWKFALIEKANPNWEDLFERINGRPDIQHVVAPDLIRGRCCFLAPSVRKKHQARIKSGPTPGWGGSRQSHLPSPWA